MLMTCGPWNVAERSIQAGGEASWEILRSFTQSLTHTGAQPEAPVVKRAFDKDCIVSEPPASK